jgi:hypothetical protein
MSRWFLALAATLPLTLGCAPPAEESPPPPPSSDRDALHTSRAPGSDDFSRGRFASPLSLSDANQILMRTEIFEYGEMPPKRQVQAFNVVFARPDAVSRFEQIAQTAKFAGRLYALAGLLLLDRAKGEHLFLSFSRTSLSITVFDSDMVSRLSVGHVAAVIRDRNLGLLMRESQASTEAYFNGRD